MTTTDRAAQWRGYFEANLDTYLDILRQMVSINSFTTNREGVDQLGRYTSSLFARLGFRTDLVQASKPAFGQHLIMTRAGQAQNGRPAPIIGLVSHLDTVFSPEEETANDFHWRPDGGRIYGPGTIDIKGGTVIIYMIMDALRTFQPDLFESVTWMVLLDATEEREGADFGQLCQERLGPDALACLVFEAGNRRGDEFLLVVARKGMAVCEVTVTGRSAHAGNGHHQGVNAILQSAQLIQHIADLTDYERDLTFNVGTIEGGTVVNRVPHGAHFLFEMRTYDKTVFAEAIRHIEAIPARVTVKSAADAYPSNIEIQVHRRTNPWQHNQGTERLFELWAAAGADLGLRVGREERGGLSDGNFTWAWVPTLDGLGPAGANSHCSEQSADGSKEQEYCIPASFVPKALLNTEAIVRLVTSALA